MVTSGYKHIMGEIKLMFGDGDPWGTGMSWLFAIAEVLYVEFGEYVPDFEPSPFLRTRDDLDDDYSTDAILYALDNGHATPNDVRNVFRVMTRYDDHLRHAGLNY